MLNSIADNAHVVIIVQAQTANCIIGKDLLKVAKDICFS